MFDSILQRLLSFDRPFHDQIRTEIEKLEELLIEALDKDELKLNHELVFRVHIESLIQQTKEKVYAWIYNYSGDFRDFK